MQHLSSRGYLGVPDRFAGVLLVAVGFMVFIAIDQSHWWDQRADYSFGWLVPFFVAYVVYERWKALQSVFDPAGPSALSPFAQGAARAGAGLLLLAGGMAFLVGALYRAGSGTTQPSSFALAFGFACILPSLVFFNVPDGQLRGAVGGAWAGNTRFRAVSLLIFPALIWLLSAPLVSAVENAISLFLLQRVVTVVFAIFNTLGFPMIQEGNVLVLPRGRVGVVEACSGIRSLMGCLFAGSFLAAVFLSRWWQKAALIGAALMMAFVANLLRSLFLTAWAYAYGSEAIEGDLHDQTGYAVLAVTVVGLFGMMALFKRSTWNLLGRWLAGRPTARAGEGGAPTPADSLKSTGPA